MGLARIREPEIDEESGRRMDGGTWRCPCGDVVHGAAGGEDLDCACGRMFNCAGQELDPNWKANAWAEGEDC